LPGLNGGGAAAAVPQGAIENSTRRNACFYWNAIHLLADHHYTTIDKRHGDVVENISVRSYD